MKHVNCVWFVIYMLAAQLAHAQCSDCTPVFTTCPATGGICNALDTGYAHHPYEMVLNFYMPQILTDPAILSECDCSKVDLNSITVTGVSGLPTGIDYLISNGGQFNVQGGDTLGCAHFCGTPILAGTYPITVYLSADVTAIGTPIGNVSENGVAQSYTTTLVVLPDTTPGVTSFTYGNNGFTACDSISITLNALLSAPSPNLTRYFWTINGQSIEGQSPGSFTFNNTSSVPDTFPVTLSTVYYNYEIETIDIIDIVGGFCGLTGGHQQLECGCLTDLDSPNPFIQIPTLGFDNSNNAPTGTCHNINFSNLNISIPAGTDSVAMQLWDLDENDLFHLYQNQLISTYNLYMFLGQEAWDDQNADGYVVMDTVVGTTITETLNVIVYPNPSTPYISAASDTFCSSDSLLIAAVPGDSTSSYAGYSFQWYKDTSYVVGIVDSSFYLQTGGSYHVIVADPASGCSSQSAVKSFTVEQTPAGPITVGFTGTEETINPFGSGLGVDWYYNGALVTGQNGGNLPFEGPGVYGATVYNISYPSCATAATADSSVTGIGQVPSQGVEGLQIFPNPNNGAFNIRFSVAVPQNITISLQNTLGQTIYVKNLENFAGNYSEDISIGNVSKGVYLLSAETQAGKQLSKVIVQ